LLLKLLVVGAGGREHALAWKLSQSPRVTAVYVAPGNAGTAATPKVTNFPASSIPVLVEFARRKNIAFTVVGPEAPLAAGIVDAFREHDLKIFGPTRRAAQLESSKEFAKEFMRRHGIPTAEYRAFSDPRASHAYVSRRGVPVVVKKDGLAAGKGVVVATSEEDAHRAVDEFLKEPDTRLLIEDCVEGEEASFIVISDGKNVLPFVTSQDHKRLLDGDRGPNTGGMGAYSPAPVVSPDLHAKIMREVIDPAIAGMASEGEPYVGFLYAGLMIGEDRSIRVLEFNCRLGDPEAQPVLLRLKSDLFNLIDRAIDGALDRIEPQWDPRAALGVVLAAKGYPDAPAKGDAIEGIPEPAEDCVVFHSGTALKNGRLVTDGGRVLCVTALGDSVRTAKERAYEAARTIQFPGKQMRSDIGDRAINRSEA
jgi:phosphoribosylamine--glycine ligase